MRVWREQGLARGGRRFLIQIADRMREAKDECRDGWQRLLEGKDDGGGLCAGMMSVRDVIQARPNRKNYACTLCFTRDVGMRDAKAEEGSEGRAV